MLLDSRFMQNISFLTVHQNGENETKCLPAGCEHKIILSPVTLKVPCNKNFRLPLLCELDPKSFLQYFAFS